MKKMLVILPGLIYTLVSIRFLIGLDDLNRHLLQTNYNKNYFGISTQDNFEVWKSFFLAVVLLSIGCFIIYKVFKRLDHYYYLEMSDMSCYIITLVLVIICMLLVIKFIAIPIFQIILMSMLGLFASGIFITNQFK